MGIRAAIQPLMPADMTLTLLYPMFFARRAAFGALLHIGFEQ